MAFLSYNEQHARQLELRHLFFPSLSGMVSEIVVGLVALILFNLSTLGDQLFSRQLGSAGGDPLQASSSLFTRLLNSGQANDLVQRGLLFVLWAFVGALIYVLLFRLAQMLFGAKSSLDTGLRYVRQEHAYGLFRWLATLHDFFVKAIFVILGTAAVIGGTLLCFGIACQELRNGLTDSFPTNLGPLAISLLGAILSVRFVALGVSLLSTRFRNWYAT